MGFHEVLFPLDIAYGSAGGPGFSTNIIELDSGAEQRVARWGDARHRYNVAYGIRSYVQLYDLIEFYIARRGPANGFRFRDYTDCTTSANGYAIELGGAIQTPDDQLLGVGDGITTQFQLIKRYIHGGFSRIRKITRPVAGTTKLKINDVEYAEGTGWSVDTTTGIITTNGPVPAAHDVEAGCIFDVPVRFGKEVDEVLAMNVESFGQGSSQDIPLVEILADGEVQDEFFYGGAARFNYSSEITLSVLGGRTIELNPSNNNLNVRMPDTTSLPGGGPYFFLVNIHATFTAKIKTFSGVSLFDLPALSMITMILSDNGAGTKTWYGVT